MSADDATLEKIAQQLASDPMLASQTIAAAMSVLEIEDRKTLAAKLLARGVDPRVVENGLMWADGYAQNGTVNFMDTLTPDQKRNFKIYSILGTVSMAASAYHGYKRNQSIGWALVWGLLGGLFPVITPVIAVAQGYGKPKE
jgi:hypothetical protein